MWRMNVRMNRLKISSQVNYFINPNIDLIKLTKPLLLSSNNSQEKATRSGILWAIKNMLNFFPQTMGGEGINSPKKLATI